MVRTKAAETQPNNLSIFLNNSDLLKGVLDDHKNVMKLLHHPDLTIELFNLISEGGYRFSALSENSVLTPAWFEKFPDEPWEFNALSRNTNVNVTWFERFPNKPILNDDEYFVLERIIFPELNSLSLWNIHLLAGNPRLDLAWLHYFPELGRNHFNELSDNINLTVDWFEQFPDASLWNFTKLSRNPALNKEWLHYWPDVIHWNFNELSNNPALTVEWFQRFPAADLWEFYFLSANPALIFEWFDWFPDAELWDPVFLSENFSLSFDWTEFLPDAENWEFDALAENPRLTSMWFDWFSDPELWDFDLLSANNSLTIDWILCFPDASLWSPGAMSYSEGLTVEIFNWFIEKGVPNDAWDFSALSENKNLNMDWFKTFPDYSLWRVGVMSMNQSLDITWNEFPGGNKVPRHMRWNYHYLSSNPRLTAEWFKWVPDAAMWDFVALSNNKSWDLEWFKCFPDPSLWNFKSIAREILNKRRETERVSHFSLTSSSSPSPFFHWRFTPVTRDSRSNVNVGI